MKIKKFNNLAISGLLLCGLLFTTTTAISQVELTPFGGYMFNGKVRFVQGDLRFSDQACIAVLEAAGAAVD